MKVEEAREIVSLIKDIYAGKKYPEEFAVKTGLYDTYLEELWPADESKLVGDWISERFNIRLFLEESEVKEFSKRVSDEFRECLFFANLPNTEAVGE